MPITAQALTDSMASALDAEGNDYYRFDRDYSFAINYAIHWIVDAVVRKLGSNRFSEEALREITKVYMYQTSTFSRVNVVLPGSPPTENVWTIVGVYPLPVTDPLNATITPVGTAYDSLLRTDVSYIKSDYNCTRLTADEWNDNRHNPFAPGFELETRNIKTFAYKQLTDYTSSVYNLDVPREIEIRPAIPSSFCALEVVKFPTEVTDIGDSVEFPVTLENVLVNLGLLWIARKQGDQTNIYGISEKDITKQIELFA